MTTALRSLTTRGRAFAAAGLTAVVCGLVLLERDLVRIGLLVVLLPLVAAGYVATRSHYLRLARTASPAHVGPGGTTTVQVRVENGGAPTGVLLMEEQLSPDVGRAPRFVVPPMGREGRELLEYVVRPEVRGRHLLGPLHVRQRDPFGMVERRQVIPGTESLLVLPQVVPLPEIRLGGARFTAGEENPRSFSVGAVADVIVREYRRGDDLRRVHWRSTARVGELMVRNEEQLWQARAVVLLDNRAGSHRGVGADSSFEAAVVAAASVTVHLAGLGYHVGLVTGSGRSETWHERGRPQDPFPVLERLATLSLVDDVDLPRVAIDEEAAGGVSVAVLGATQPEERRWWSHYPRHSAAGLALALDVESWGRQDEPQRPASSGSEGPERSEDSPSDATPTRWLNAQGWQASQLRRGAALATAWQELNP